MSKPRLVLRYLREHGQYLHLLEYQYGYGGYGFRVNLGAILIAAIPMMPFSVPSPDQVTIAHLRHQNRGILTRDDRYSDHWWLYKKTDLFDVRIHTFLGETADDANKIAGSVLEVLEARLEVLLGRVEQASQTQ